MGDLPGIPGSAPSDGSSGGIGYLGPGSGISPDRGAVGPPPGGDATPENVCGAYPGDQDGDEMGEGFDQNLLSDFLRLR